MSLELRLAAPPGGRRELAGDRLAGRLELLEQDRHADVAGVDAERRGQLEHLHDLLGRRAVGERLLDVLADARARRGASRQRRPRCR